MTASLTICGVEVHEWDHVRLTGICSSFDNQRLENVTGVIGTVSVKDGPAIKVWPEADIDNGKLWFLVDGIESLELLESGEDMR